MTKRKTSVEKVLSIIDNHGHNIENVNEQTNLKDYIDSLEQAEIVLSIEKELNANIPDDEIENWVTISDIVTTYELYKYNTK